jgi:hypothetical protein
MEFAVWWLQPPTLRSSSVRLPYPQSGRLFVNRSYGRKRLPRTPIPETFKLKGPFGPPALGGKIQARQARHPLSTQVDARAEASIDLAVIGKG